MLFPFKRVPLPDKPRFFSTVEWAHPGCWEVHRLSAAALFGPVSSALAFGCRCVPSVSTHGKNRASPAHPIFTTLQRPSVQSLRGCFVSRSSELGKSQGYSFRQKSCQPQSFLRHLNSPNHHLSLACSRFLLHKVKVSPYLRLVE